MARLGTSSGRTPAPGIVHVIFEMTSDGTGVFKTADIKGDNDFVRGIETVDLPDGVFIVALRSKIYRFAFVDISTQNPAPTYYSAGKFCVGSLAPLGFNDDHPYAQASFGYRLGGALAVAPPNTTVTVCLDIQTMNTRTR